MRDGLVLMFCRFFCVFPKILQKAVYKKRKTELRGEKERCQKVSVFHKRKTEMYFVPKNDILRKYKLKTIIS